MSMSILTRPRETSTRVRFDSRLAPAPVTFGRGVLPVEPAEVIPPDVTRIRIVGLVSAGTYTATTDGHGRREWADESKPGSRLLGGFADRRYREGKVAILADAAKRASGGPASVPTTTSAPSDGPVDPKAESVAWKLGFDLGRGGEDADLPSGVSARIRASFASGLEAGSRQREADLEATDRLEHAGRESEQPQWVGDLYSPCSA
jgi:hypothetical protein